MTSHPHSQRPHRYRVAALLAAGMLGLTAAPVWAAPATQKTDKPTAIADIQGTTDISPMDHRKVTTSGIVTAAYPQGGLKGYYLQTPGTGGDQGPTPGRSDGLFVYSPDTVGQVRVGEQVKVFGQVSEYYGQTQISVSAGAVSEIHDAAPAVKPFTGLVPEDPAAREALEGMLLQPSGEITVTDSYATNRYGEIGLVNGSKALPQSTDVARPGSEAQAVEAANARKEYLLDDGATVDYTRGASGTPVPYLSNGKPVRAGEPATFTQPVILGYGYDSWRLQPTTWLTGGPEAAAPATFGNTRVATPQKVGGDVSVASFNVLNYFPTTGDQLSGCQYYKDRENNPITVSGGCDARGAANQENLDRQQRKIVEAITSLDASVLSLEEIENSARFGQNRDAALHQLVDALNQKAGTDKWKAVDSPATVPGSEDVIRTAFIYQPAKVTPSGDSTILADPAFDNARRPLAQAFQPTASGSDKFLAIVNHFKSKGSGEGPGNEDAGDGQGASNASRVAQAKALATFAADQQSAAATDNTVLLGDFNSYTQEDPMQVLYEAGFQDIGSAKTTKQTYLFGGRVGSLDHVLASGPMFDAVAGADVWNINSVESVGLEYSRFNNNVTNLYAPDAYRSSDHDPLLVGFNTVSSDSGHHNHGHGGHHGGHGRHGHGGGTL
ncbi:MULTISPECIES: ExeM/NucH family extracellular endonuclease [Micrococcales]|uniref:ExeM/NucH family extracellular endonuclease n=1 Tax=Micrococcales TaxID=85006 RepID=UPI0006915DD7|nr:MULTISPECIES: ExeM/NucH family extracellular endonuclease [Micrococcales]